jgi:hypothetical protein
MRGPDALMCVVRLKTRKEEGPPSNADWGTVQRWCCSTANLCGSIRHELMES